MKASKTCSLSSSLKVERHSRQNTSSFHSSLQTSSPFLPKPLSLTDDDDGQVILNDGNVHSLNDFLPDIISIESASSRSTSSRVRNSSRVKSCLKKNTSRETSMRETTTSIFTPLTRRDELLTHNMSSLKGDLVSSESMPKRDIRGHLRGSTTKSKIIEAKLPPLIPVDTSRYGSSSSFSSSYSSKTSAPSSTTSTSSSLSSSTSKGSRKSSYDDNHLKSPSEKPFASLPKTSPSPKMVKSSESLNLT